ncbi:steroid hormone receptor ERR1-like isoform X2 [Culicoides brevitarsis]|uniref:steroid hormone receptor ERR1-like isoform X2 n=1 Tax=Culicoides brevitarsis TaxID=469753 RepID=UPI00307C809F
MEVSMMTEGSTRIKQEIDISCCSPTPSSNSSNNNNNLAHTTLLFNSSEANLEYKCNPDTLSSPITDTTINSSTPNSPDRQFCSSTSALGDFSSDSLCPDTVKTEDLPRRVCLVCGDTASGFHYGVASCEACKAFFKRTIQGNIEYSCPANNDCEINKRRRKACQACRFRKCLQMGMLKEGVRLDRVRGGRQKYRRNPNVSPYQLPASSTSLNRVQSLEDIKFLNTLMQIKREPITLACCGIDLQTANRQSMDSHLLSKISIGDTESFMDTDEATSTMISTTEPQDFLSVLSGLYDYELTAIIGWAKQVPGFLELPLNDQMKLLQASWAEIHTLRVVSRSIPLVNGRLNFASDFSLDEAAAKECGASELYNYFVHLTQRFERISTSKEEFYLLKALLLANCDVMGLENQADLKKLRDSILSALNDCVFVSRNMSAISHQQQLLLLLPAMRQAKYVVRNFWTDVHRIGRVKQRLLVEMIEGKI